MQMVRTRFSKQGGLRSRIVAIDGRAVHIAFGKTDDLAVLEVDSGKYDHDLVSSAASAWGQRGEVSEITASIRGIC